MKYMEVIYNMNKNESKIDVINYIGLLIKSTSNNLIMQISRDVVPYKVVFYTPHISNTLRG